MFSKVAVVVTTTAGIGGKRAAKSIARQLFWFGVPAVFRFSARVSALSWETVSEKIKKKTIARCIRLAASVSRKIGRTRPGLRQRFLFGAMRGMQKSNTWNPTDKNHWEENGWLGKTRPWK
jgi:hypothetical protein